MSSLTPEPSPALLKGGRLSPEARRGKALFEDSNVGCSSCHKQPYYTDLKLHDVGTRGSLDRADRFDTPSLIEGYRTAPYLHDGRAPTVHDAIVWHGGDAQPVRDLYLGLEDDEQKSLQVFLLSLDREPILFVP